VQAVAAGAALALAAGVAVVARSGDRAEAPRAPVASVVAPHGEVASEPAGPTVAQQNVSPQQGVEVDEIDSPSRGISVFEIPLGSAAAAAGAPGQVAPSSVVIWIDDEPGVK
jgi:hypothetical protein